MRSAITTWLFPLIVVEVDPSDFDGPGAPSLLARLGRHFSGVSVSMITPDWEADSGIRVAGLGAPVEVLASPTLKWRELVLLSEDELPF